LTRNWARLARDRQSGAAWFVGLNEAKHILERPHRKAKTFELTPAKKVIAAYREEGETRKFLLFGVTGSGKTHVFFEMFDDVLKQGKQCLLLVPEISLTPQMMALVKSRFPQTVAIMHSKLTPAQRYAEFLKIKRGEARIVLGARSAVFMPFKELGIIVVDEEHENSYKSSQSPRYDTIEVANKIADLTGCDLVLASATPSTETYYRAMLGEYRLLTLPKRVNDIPMPVIAIADMREELRNGNRTPVSRMLADSIAEKLARHEQTLLFLNRRGYNTYVFCRSCGAIEMCPHCEVSLTYHKNSDSLICHYCGYKKKISKTCPSCGSDKIKLMGTGTEKIQKSIEEMFPQARVMRLDSDVATQRGAYEKVLGSFARGEADILIGTQMIVKGLDFDNVTLVGILLADASLNFPDINAAARTFQLTSQAAGRAGRREKQGRVIMQTYAPENETLVYCARHDYEGFYAYDIAHRRKMDYPPFSEVIGMFVASEDIEACMKDCEYIYKRLNDIANAHNYGKRKT
jgi:primosomal protein N' (replication factor Y)